MSPRCPAPVHIDPALIGGAATGEPHGPCMYSDTGSVSIDTNSVSEYM